jgi:hypothetical protein
MRALGELNHQLMERGEATDLFANPRSDGLDGIFGNLDQSVFGEPAYPTVESKAAHLLYFVVKNHPFSGGNTIKSYSKERCVGPKSVGKSSISSH